MWALADVVGLFSFNVGPFSPNVGQQFGYSQPMWVRIDRCYRAGGFMFSGRYIYRRIFIRNNQ